MTSKTCWKGRESLIAEWFNTKRNPLSGRNNRADDGSRRLGDTLYPHAVVEVKLRKYVAPIARALETEALAKEASKPWIHIESLKGTRKVFCIVLDAEHTKYCIDKLREKWEKGTVKRIENGALQKNT